MVETISEPSRETPVVERADVVVCGGGTAGFVAAIAAARNGAKAILIEQYGFLGGTAVMPMTLLTFHISGKQVIKGIAQEVVDRLISLEGSDGHWVPPTHGPYSWTLYDPEIMKIVALEIVEEAGVKLLLHSYVVDTVVEEGVVKGVIIENKSGRQAIMAKVLIDCTGDGDVAARAGAPFEKGREEDGLMQSINLMFRLTNLDVDRLKKTMNAKDDRFMVVGFRDMLLEAKRKGELPAEVDGVLCSPTFRKGELAINMARVHNVDCTNAIDLTRAEAEARKEIIPIIRFLRKIPGLESAYLMDSGHQVGVRETRRIIGEYRLTKDDVLAGRKFDDIVAKGAWAIDIASPTRTADGRPTSTHIRFKEAYDIPYRCLVPKKIDNLLVAGRCISADHEANSSARVIVTCMALGQAAGTAAALCVKNNVTPRALDVKLLQKTLMGQGAILKDP